MIAEFDEFFQLRPESSEYMNRIPCASHCQEVSIRPACGPCVSLVTPLMPPPFSPAQICFIDSPGAGFSNTKRCPSQATAPALKVPSG